MATLIGIPTQCFEASTGGQHHEVGKYTYDWTKTPTFIDVAYPCPICAKNMRKVKDPETLSITRITKACSGGAVCDAIGDPLSPGLDLLSCKTCQIFFTLPQGEV